MFNRIRNQFYRLSAELQSPQFYQIDSFNILITDELKFKQYLTTINFQNILFILDTYATPLVPPLST